MEDKNEQTFTNPDKSIRWKNVFKIVGSPLAIVVFFFSIWRLGTAQVEINTQHELRITNIERETQGITAVRDYMQSIEKRIIRIETMLEEDRRKDNR